MPASHNTSLRWGAYELAIVRSSLSHDGAKTASAAPWWRHSRLLLAVPMLASALVFFVAEGVFPTPSSVRDAYTYTMTAQRLVTEGYFAFSGDPPSQPQLPNARVTPGWPVVLAAVYSAVGVEEDPIASVRGARGAVTALLFLCSLGIVATATLSCRLLGGDRLGLVGGLFTAFYLPVYWAATVALAEQLGALLFSISIYVALRLTAPSATRTIWAAALLGATCALTVLVRPNLILWTFVPLLYIAVRRLEGPQRLLRLGAAGLLGFCLVMSPWWVRNAVVLGRFVPLKTQYVRVAAEEKTAGPTPVSSAAPEEHWAPTSFGMNLTLMSTPWIPALDVVFEEMSDPDLTCVQYPSRCWVPMWMGDALIIATFWYQRVLLLLAALSLFFVRRAQRLVILACAPLAVLAVHWSHLTTRYLYPTMPAVIVMAACAFYATARWLHRRGWRPSRAVPAVQSDG